jgi:hypothetical protein
MDMFELLLLIKEAVGDETFLDALALIQATHPPPHPSGGACTEEHGNRRTRLPHNFICGLHHQHPITSIRQLLTERQPRCLLERILLEWASFDPTEPPAEGGVAGMGGPTS